MLGAYADQFFHKQARERVIAVSPNGVAGTYTVPGREESGTGSVSRVSGAFEMPGPQDVVDANTMMPVANSMLPGMGQDDALPVTNAMLPGMGRGDMLPGMGFLDMNKGLLIAGVVAVGFFLMRRR